MALELYKELELDQFHAMNVKTDPDLKLRARLR
jgi:hypothetical protein